MFLRISSTKWNCRPKNVRKKPLTPIASSKCAIEVRNVLINIFIFLRVDLCWLVPSSFNSARRTDPRRNWSPNRDNNNSPSKANWLIRRLWLPPSFCTRWNQPRWFHQRQSCGWRSIAEHVHSHSSAFDTYNGGFLANGKFKLWKNKNIPFYRFGKSAANGFFNSAKQQTTQPIAEVFPSECLTNWLEHIAHFIGPGI